jgi:DNA-directed RNA polymerase subunit RPC12/RpoP
MALVKCPECGREVSSIAKACPGCGAPIDTAVRCPKCGSTNVSVISGASKAVSIALWGVFAANKVMSKYKCDDCGHKF